MMAREKRMGRKDFENAVSFFVGLYLFIDSIGQCFLSIKFDISICVFL